MQPAVISQDVKPYIPPGIGVRDDPSEARLPNLMPEAATFLKEHPEFGRPQHARNLTEWAEGKLQRVDFSDGRSLAFYELDGRIITVRDRSPGRDSVIVWGESYEPPPFIPYDKPAQDDLPAYHVALIIDLAKGGRHGEVIVPSLSVLTTTLEEREEIAQRIAQAEEVDELDLYSNEEAREANQSASYSDKHPGALEAGYLGRLDATGFHALAGKATPGDDEAEREARDAQMREAAAAQADAVAAHRARMADLKKDFDATIVVKARKAASRFPKNKNDLRQRAVWRVYDDEISEFTSKHAATSKELDQIRADYPEFRSRLRFR